MQQQPDNKNLLLAIGLSVLVMVGWNYFYGMPQAEKTRQAAQSTQAQQPNQGAAPAQPNAAPAAGQSGQLPGSNAPAGALLPRADALAATKRIAIETPALKGSISLKGGRFDDLAFVNYRETVDPKSPNVVLFSPAEADKGYYADFGWVPTAGSTIIAPNADSLWQTTGGALTPSNPVTMTFDNGQGLIFTRKISVDDKFMFTVVDEVSNATAAPVSLSPYGRISRVGTPHVDGIYVLHEGLIGYLGDNKLQEIVYKDMDKQKSKSFKDVKGGWLGITDKYWASALIPEQDRTYSAAFGVTAATPQVYEAAAVANILTIAPGTKATTTTRLFAGAKEVSVIDGYESKFKIASFELMIDWGWFHFITKPLFWLMEIIKGFVGNFGVTILIVTVLIKLLFFPLANKSYKSMAMMKEAAPEMQSIKERFPEDRVRQQQEMMELYKRKKINPMAGCLPMVVQIPVFFALYKVIYITIEMRQAPFFGWIKDLSAPDPTSIFNLFGLLPYAVPNISLFHLGVWPVLMGITMWLQMKMNPEPPDPIQKQIFGWMPLIFTFMLGSFPAGLVIYWAWNNLLSVLQQYVIMRKMGVKVELWDNLRATFGRKKAA
ncbi:MAG: membrane protein insertase YidC [Proteobacteria bacterium]|nr:membrane protein insertase YidC [Pseudomonadota bacterium]